MRRSPAVAALGALVLVALVYFGQSAPDIANLPSQDTGRTTAPAPQTPARTTGYGTGFELYVLSLSWSPTFCASRGGDGRNRRQCGADTSFGLVVHGLWPQNTRSSPEFCRSDEPDRVPERLGQPLLDIMPDMGLIGHEWRKHGTCSGLSQRDYLGAIRAAWQKLALPDDLRRPEADRVAGVDAIEDALVSGNPGLTRDAITVTCKGNLMEDIRICMTPSLGFRACPTTMRQSCRARSIQLPSP